MAQLNADLFRAFIRCVDQNRRDISRCQLQFNEFDQALSKSEVTLRKFAKPCTQKPEPEEEQDEDHPSIHLEKTAIADGFTKVLPQVFDGEAKREKTFLARTLEKVAPRFFVEPDEDEDDDDDDDDDE